MATSTFCYSCDCTSCCIARRDEIGHDVQKLISNIRAYGSMVLDTYKPETRDHLKTIVRRLRRQLDLNRSDLLVATMVVDG